MLDGNGVPGVVEIVPGGSVKPEHIAIFHFRHTNIISDLARLLFDGNLPGIQIKAFTADYCAFSQFSDV